MRILNYNFFRPLLYRILIRLFFKKARIILDLGCGPGVFTAIANKYGFLIIGFDVDIKPLVSLKKRGLNIVRCDILSLPLRNDIADGIFCSHVVEHIPRSDMLALFSEFKRVLKNRGRVMIITPTEHPWFWTPGHVVAYTREKVKELFLSFGFIPLKICYDKKLLGLPENRFLVRLLNYSPVYFLRMNILAVGTVQKR